MAFGLFGRNTTKIPRTGRGDRVYVIGDIHGRYDLFRAALDRIEQHHSALPKPQALYVVLLGDLVDRGPDSARVLEFVHQVQSRTPYVVTLKGNHEEMMVRAIDGEPGLMRAWLRSGGKDTLRSLGMEVPRSDEEMAMATAELRRRLAPELVDWMRGLPLTAQSGDYLFCHAGVRPGVPIKRQQRDDLLWIREEFLTSEQDHGAVIVHGHSVSAELEMRPNRIGIDTGAYRSGTLSVLYLEGEKREVISVKESELPPVPARDGAEGRDAKTGGGFGSAVGFA